MASASSGSDSEVTLNLYPMMDIFSILITFLLMSFSADPVSHQVNPALELPDSKTLTSLDEIPTIVVTKNEIFVNDKKVSTIQGGDVIESDRDQGAVRPLFDELNQLREAMKNLAKRPAAPVDPAAPPKKDESTLTLEMDKEHPFRIMRRIMLSAQQAEFVTFKLMVVKEML